jgi:thioesterase DpgC
MKQATESPSLRAAGLPEALISEWQAAEPEVTGDLGQDRRSHGEFWRRSDALLARLPRKAARAAAEAATADAIHAQAREARERFLRRHAEAVYAELTRGLSRFVRVEELVLAAAEAFPGLTPTRQQIAAEAGLLQRDKDGLEIDQGI